jgi:hypothetical protein
MKFISNMTMGMNPAVFCIEAETQYERMALTDAFESCRGKLCITVCRDGDEKYGDITNVLVYKRAPKQRKKPSTSHNTQSKAQG